MYFILPILVLIFGPVETIGQIDLTSEFKYSLIVCLSLTGLFYLIAIRFLQKNIIEKIDYALNKFKEIDDISLPYLFYIIITFFAAYGMWLFFRIDPEMSRDDRFSLIESQSIGPIFMLMIKIGVLASVKSLQKGKKIYPIIFVSIIAIITFLTLSRSLLVLIILPLIPFSNISSKKTIIILVFIFFSRFIFTNNLDFTWEWWLIFGFGEMLGVLTGPLAIMKFNPSISFFETINLILNSIPGLSILTNFMSVNGRIPELAVYVNNLTKNNLGIYGVASTPFTDILLSPPTFFISLLVLIISFLLIMYPRRYNQLSAYFISSFYIAFGFSITSFYRWSFSGAVYSLLRDTFLFVVFILLLKSLNIYLRRHLVKPVSTS